MRNITQHIIHCSDSTFGDAAIIRKWHKERGWRDIGYHFVIRTDGEIELGRPLNEIGAHCKGQNRYSVGTCLIGKKYFSQAQFLALEKVHIMLKQLFPRITLHPHCEFNVHKTCPNFDVHSLPNLT